MTTKIDLVNEAADWSEKAGNGVIAEYLREYAKLLAEHQRLITQALDLKEQFERECG